MRASAEHSALAIERGALIDRKSRENESLEAVERQTSCSWDLEWPVSVPPTDLHAEGITPVMYDKNSYYGGHTASFRYENGVPVRRRPAHFFYQGCAHSGAFCRERRAAVRDDPDQPEQLLEGALAAASGAVASPRIAGRRGRQGNQRFCGRAPGAGTHDSKLLRLAASELREDFCRSNFRCSTRASTTPPPPKT